MTYVNNLNIVLNNINKVIFHNNTKYIVGKEYILSVYYQENKFFGELDEISTCVDEQKLLTYNPSETSIKSEI